VDVAFSEFLSTGAERLIGDTWSEGHGENPTEYDYSLMGTNSNNFSCGPRGELDCKYDLFRLFNAYLYQHFRGSVASDDAVYRMVRYVENGQHIQDLRALGNVLMDPPLSGRIPGTTPNQKVGNLYQRFAMARYANDNTYAGGIYGFGAVSARSFRVFEWVNSGLDRKRVVPPVFLIGDAMDDTSPHAMTSWTDPVQPSAGSEPFRVLTTGSDYYLFLADSSLINHGCSRDLSIRIRGTETVPTNQDFRIGYMVFNGNDSTLYDNALTGVVETVPVTISGNTLDTQFTISDFGALKKGVVLVFSMVEANLSAGFSSSGLVKDMDYELTYQLVPDTLTTPGNYASLGSAMSASCTGDVIILTTNGNEGSYSPFYLAKDILITGESGEMPVINGMCTLQKGEVRRLKLKDVSGNWSVVKTGLLQSDNVTVRDCVLMGRGSAAGSRGVGYNDGNVTFINCTVDSVKELAYPNFFGGSYSGRLRFENCHLFGERGFYLELGGKTELIKSTMLRLYGSGGYAFDLANGRDARIEQSIVGGFNPVFSACPTDVVEHNILYNYSSLGCGSISSSTNLLNTTDPEYPLFCHARENKVKQYSLRIDSPAAAGNNSFGLDIGADGVECAWGSLARSTTMKADVVGTVLEDLTVPSGKTLTMKEGSSLKFDENDNSGGGSDTENELLIIGSLDVDGTAAKPVRFTSSLASPSEGEWAGVVGKSGGYVDIDHADIQYGKTGLRSESGVNSLKLTNSLLANNQVTDVTAAGNSGAVITLTGNTLTVGSGSGIVVMASKATVSGNTITGNGSTIYGIDLEAESSDQLISGNTVQDVSAGPALYVGGASGAANKIPSVRKNILRNSLQGIKVVTSKAAIGAPDSSSEKNTITGNSVGISCEGSNAKPTIRSNDISSNTTHGIVAKSSANPDVGKSLSLGGNKIVNNGTYCIYNRNTSGTISAQGNFLGTTTGCPLPTCFSGNVDISDWLCTAPFSVDIPMEALPRKPQGFRVQGFSPNPTHAGGRLKFTLDRGMADLDVEVFDVTGRRVREVSHLQVGPGDHEVAWFGDDQQQRPVQSGIYFLRVHADGIQDETIKVLVVR